MARIMLARGGLMFGIDLVVGMPAWWTTLEGPAFAATGLMVLIAQY
jgi:hypothetical protein